MALKKRPLVDHRPWGKFEEYTHNEKTTVKIITVKKGGILSLQSHRKRKELWVALDKGLTAFVGRKRKKLRPGEMIIIPKGAKHRIMSARNARFLEISFGNFDEGDIKRFEDVYGRA